MLALRREPEVRHDRDPGLRQRLHVRHEPLAAFELDGVRAALLHEPEGRGERLLGADLVAAERQVGDHERALAAPHHRLDQRHQLVDRHRQGVVVAVDVVGGRVPDEQHRDAGLVEDLRGVHVVGGEHRPPLAAFLELPQVMDPGSLRPGPIGAGPVGRRHFGRANGPVDGHVRHRCLLLPRGLPRRVPGS